MCIASAFDRAGEVLFVVVAIQNSNLLSLFTSSAMIRKIWCSTILPSWNDKIWMLLFIVEIYIAACFWESIDNPVGTTPDPVNIQYNNPNTFQERKLNRYVPHHVDESNYLRLDKHLQRSNCNIVWGSLKGEYWWGCILSRPPWWDHGRPCCAMTIAECDAPFIHPSHTGQQRSYARAALCTFYIKAFIILPTDVTICKINDYINQRKILFCRQVVYVQSRWLQFYFWAARWYIRLQAVHEFNKRHMWANKWESHSPVI